MQKKGLLVSGLFLSTIVLAGCFSAKDSPSEEQDFAYASCNDYVALMRCVASQQGGEALTVVEQAITTWKSLPENELNQTCDMAMEVAIANAAAYEQLGCKVPGDFVTPIVQEDMIEQDMMEEDLMEDDMTQEGILLEDTTEQDAMEEDNSIVEEITSELVDENSAE